MILFVLTASLLSLAGCGGEETTGLHQEEADEHMAKPVSTWDLLGDLNKVEHLDFELLPKPQEDGSLPRSTGAFHLGMEPPREGKQIRDMEVLLIQEKGRERHIRIFSRNDSVYRLWTFIRKKFVPEEDVEALFARARQLYGEPDQEIMNNLIWVDLHTVLTVKSGGRFFMVEIQDVDRGKFSEDLLLLIDKVMQREVKRRKQQ